MGSIFQYAVKVLTVTAKLVIAALTTTPAHQTPPIAPVLTEKSAPAYHIYMKPSTDDRSVRYFETSEGKVFIFRDDRGILP